MAQSTLISRFKYLQLDNFLKSGAVVVTQLVERLLPIPEVRGLNPVIGKNLFIY